MAAEAPTGASDTTTLLFQCEGDTDDQMLGALRAALPEHAIRRWPDEIGCRSDIDQAVVWMPPDDLFDGLGHLSHVHLLAAGTDHLLSHPGLPPTATVLRLEDAGMGEQMAAYVLYGVLHAHRRFVDLATAARQRRWAHDTRVVPAAEHRVGILGAGVLASRVAERLVDNGYPVACWSRGTRCLPAGVAGHVGDAGLDDMLARTDTLVCLLPLTDATRGILARPLFAKLRPGAYLINCARGGHLCETDLSAALDDGQLGGALLDVFQTEPLPDSHPFWQDPRIIVTPHLAAPSQVSGSIEQVAHNVRAIASGRELIGVVDRSRGY